MYRGKKQDPAEISNSGVLERLSGFPTDSWQSQREFKNTAVLRQQSRESAGTSHRRNEVLIRQKIIAIRETIASFSLEDNPLSEIYDNLGNIKKDLRKRSHNFD